MGANACIILTNEWKNFAEKHGFKPEIVRILVQDYINNDVNSKEPTQEQFLEKYGTKIEKTKGGILGWAFKAKQETYKLNEEVVEKAEKALAEELAEKSTDVKPYNKEKAESSKLISGGSEGADTVFEALAKIYSTKKEIYSLGTGNLNHENFGVGRRAWAKKMYERVIGVGEHKDKLYTLNRRQIADYKLVPILRSICAAADANGVFAVGRLQQPGEKIGEYTNNSFSPVVEGEAGYVVQAAIIMNEENKKKEDYEQKEIHVFDLRTNKWYKWDPNAVITVYDKKIKSEIDVKGNYVEEETPILTSKFAGVGTHELESDRKENNDNWKNASKALTELFKNSFGSHVTNNMLEKEIGSVTKEREKQKDTITAKKKGEKPKTQKEIVGENIASANENENTTQQSEEEQKENKVFAPYHKKSWTRDDVNKDKETLYIFTDNTNRTSWGKQKVKVNPDSWYGKKYAKKGETLYAPGSTSAVIRGLDNARPISTQKHWQEDTKKEQLYKKNRWTNNDIDEFKKVIDDEIQAIKDAWDERNPDGTYKYKRVVTPYGDGFFNSGISDISESGDRSEIYKYLKEKIDELQKYIEDTAGERGEVKEVEKPKGKKQIINPLGKDYKIPSQEDVNKSTIIASTGSTKESKESQNTESSNPFGYSSVSSFEIEKQKGTEVAKVLSKNQKREEREREKTRLEDIRVSRDLEKEIEAKNQTRLEKLTTMGLSRKEVLDMTSYCANKFSEAIEYLIDVLIADRLQKSDPNVTTNELERKVYEKQLEMLQDKEKAHQAVFACGMTLKDVLDLVRKSVKSHTIPGEIGVGFFDRYQTDEELKKYYMSEFGYSLSENEASKLVEQHNKIFKLFDNEEVFEIIMNLSAAQIEVNENIKINIKENSVDDSSEDENQSEQQTEEDEFADYVEGWSFNMSKIDPHLTLRNIVRRALLNLKERTQDNKYIPNSMGEPVIIDEEYVHAIIINECAKEVRYVEDFYYKEITEDGEERFHFPILEKLQERFPFIDELMDKLIYDDQLRSSFYSEFRKNKLNHTVIDSKSGSAILINHTASSLSSVESARSVYERGITINNGIKTIWNNNWTVNLDVVKEVDTAIKDVISILGNQRYRTVEEIEDERKERAALYCEKIFKSIGFDISAKDILSYLADEDGRKNIIDAVKSANKIVLEFKGYVKDDINRHIFDDEKFAFQNIGNKIGKLSNNYIQLSVNQGGVQLQSYVAPNYIGNMIRRFNDPNEERRMSYILNEFGKDDFFFHKDRDGNIIWENDLLRALTGQQTEEENFIKPEEFDICEVSMVNLINGTNKKYTECTPDEIAANSYAFYFSDGEDSERGWIQTPIYSDSPSSNFIKVHRYIDNDKKEVYFEDQLRPKFNVLIRQELKRINKVQKLKQAGTEPIQHFYKRGEKFCFLPMLNGLEIGEIVNGLEDKLSRLRDEASEDNKNDKITQARLNHEIAHTERQIASLSELIENGNLNEDKTFLDSIIETNDEYGPNDLDIIDTVINCAVDYIMEDSYNEYRDELIGIPKYKNKKRIPSKLENDIYAIINRRGAERKVNVVNGSEFESNRRFSRDPERRIREYYWNTMYMTSQIYQLCITDLAYYKDDVDTQKRFKELHVFGTQLDTNSKYGRENEHIIYLSDDNVMSESINGIKASLDLAVEQKRLSKKDADMYYNMFKDICRTDSQAYRSPKAFRAVMDMLGKWDDNLEEAFERLQSGNYEEKDLRVVFNVIKPYMYATPNIHDGIGGYCRVSMQNKNSEVMLMSAFNMLANVLTKSKRLAALSEFMDENDIDVAMFSTACKVGVRGIININVSPQKVRDAVQNKSFDINFPGVGLSTVKTNGGKTYEEIMYGIKDKNGKVVVDGFAQDLEKGKITQEIYHRFIDYFSPSRNEVKAILNSHVLGKIKDADVMDDYRLENGNDIKYNTTYVTTVKYENYCIVQPTPTHLVDTTANLGSQFQNLALSNIPDGAKIDMRVEVIDEETGKKEHVIKQYTKEEAIKEFQKMLTENLLESFNKIFNTFADIHTLQKRLFKSMQGNPTYGPDVVNALEIIEYNGKEVFNIPFSSPQIFYQLSDMINALFKKNITKQKSNGGYAYLMSDYGLSNLQVVRDPNTGRIKHVECLLPAWAKDMFDVYLEKKYDNNGKLIGEELDIKRIERECPKLLEIVGYRTPTEGKWSMAPLKVVGFLPPQCGNMIVMPADICTHAGTDFDIDKLFLMMHNTVKSRDGKRLHVVEYDDTKGIEESTKEQRDNRMLDVAFSILTTSGVDMEFNTPNSFNKIRVQAKLQNVINDRGLQEKLIDRINEWIRDNRDNPKYTEKIRDFIHECGKKGALLQDRSGIKELTAKILLDVSRNHQEFLKKFVDDNKTERNILSPNTFRRFFEQNMAGLNLVGIFAVNSTSSSKIQTVGGIEIKTDDIKYISSTGESDVRRFRFSVNGREIDTVDKQYITFRNGDRESVTKNIGECLAASVDNGKEPLLKDIGMDETSGGLGSFMLRLGMTIEEVSLFFSHPQIKKILQDAKEKGFGEALKGYTSFDELDITQLNIDTDLILEDIVDSMYGRKPQAEYGDDKRIEAICAIFKHIYETLYNEYAPLVKLTRCDSVNGALKNTIASGVAKVIELDSYREKAKKRSFPFVNISKIIENGFLTNENGKFPTTSNGKLDLNTLRKKLDTATMMNLQAYHTFGIEAASILPSEYYLQLTPYMNNLLRRISREGRYLSEDTINTIYDYAVQFVLSGTTLFGDTDKKSYAEKRDYYLNDFPQDFRTTIKKSKSKEMKEIKKLGFFRRLSVKRGEVTMSNGADVRGLLLEIYMNDTLSMLSMGEEGRQLALDLFSYCYYKDNFRYGKDSYSRMFSSLFLNRIPAFVDAIRNAPTNMNIAPNEPKGSIITGTVWDRFEDQLYTNMPSLINKTFRLDPTAKGSRQRKINQEITDALESMDDDKITIDRSLVVNYSFTNEDNTNETHNWIRINIYDKNEQDMPVLKDTRYFKKVSEDNDDITYQEFECIKDTVKAFNMNKESREIVKEVNQIHDERVKRKKNSNIDILNRGRVNTDEVSDESGKPLNPSNIYEKESFGGKETYDALEKQQTLEQERLDEAKRQSEAVRNVSDDDVYSLLAKKYQTDENGNILVDSKGKPIPKIDPQQGLEEHKMKPC